MNNRVRIPKSIKSLAKILGENHENLMAISDSVDRSYKGSKLRKKNGTFRDINNPNPRLKAVQRKIKSILLDPLLCSSISFGGIKGRSVKQCANFHVKKESVASIDIKNFFPSVHNGLVNHLLLDLGYSSKTAHIVTKLTTYQNQLPQGSPTSTCMANLYLEKFDHEIMNLCRDNNVTVTRFVDDIHFSGKRENVEAVMPQIISLLTAHKMKINRQKVKFSHNGRAQRVCGLTVNQKLSVGRSYIRKVEGEIKRLRKFGINRHDYTSMAGKINHINQTNCKPASRLRKKLVELKLKLD